MLIGTTLRDHWHPAPWTAARLVAEALAADGWQITPAPMVDPETETPA
jgi:hypothetical protein